MFTPTIFFYQEGFFLAFFVHREKGSFKSKLISLWNLDIAEMFEYCLKNNIQKAGHVEPKEEPKDAPNIGKDINQRLKNRIEIEWDEYGLTICGNSMGHVSQLYFQKFSVICKIITVYLSKTGPLLYLKSCFFIRL